MSKKKKEELLKRIREAVQRLTPETGALSASEVRELLETAGCDTKALRNRLNSVAKELANAQRAKGRPAPRYLREVIESTSLPDQLPSDPKKALEKAKQWLDYFTSISISGKELQVSRAYRKPGELSEKDAALLDSMEQDLKKKAGQEND